MKKLAVVALIAIMCRGAAAEQGSYEGGRFISGPRKDINTFMQGCPSDILKEYASSQSCSLKSTAILGSAGHRAFGSVKYTRTVDASTLGRLKIARESSEEILTDLLVIELSGDGEARPIWYDYFIEAYTFIDRVDLIDTPQGMLFDVAYCVNGTAGCRQYTFIRMGKDWKRLRKDATWAAMEKSLPEGYGIGKSPTIDYRHLRSAAVNVSAPYDAYCCPSGRIDLQLEIIGDQLTIRNYKLMLPSPRAGTSAYERRTPAASDGRHEAGENQ